MNATYPTKEEIEEQMKYSEPESIIINIIKKWKEKHYTKKWKTTTKEKRKNKIEELLQTIWKNIEKEPKLNMYWGEKWSYTRTNNTIQGDKNNISIISALHELGHAIHGQSELYACTFSINHFKTCFPKEFGRLSWKGHMLIKN